MDKQSGARPGEHSGRACEVVGGKRWKQGHGEDLVMWSPDGVPAAVYRAGVGGNASGFGVREDWGRGDWD